MSRAAALLLCASGLSACASASQVDRLEVRLAAMEAELAVARENGEASRHELAELRAALEAQRAELLLRLEVAQKKPDLPAAPKPSSPSRDQVLSVPIEDSPFLGPADAWVTIVMFSEFQCPFCARVQATLREVREKYPTDVRLVFKHQPLAFHTSAYPAAVAAACAGEQGEFWTVHDLLFADPQGFTSGVKDYLEPKLPKQMRKKEWAACIEADRPRPKIERDQALAEKVGARGVPTFFVNGRYLSGAQPFESFRLLIDEELEKAKKSGIPRQEYYDKAVVKRGS